MCYIQLVFGQRRDVCGVGVGIAIKKVLVEQTSKGVVGFEDKSLISIYIILLRRLIPLLTYLYHYSLMG
jgi:hypothetical protein